MLPSLKIVKAGLRRTTEALALELALPQPSDTAPEWSDLEWQLASAAAVAHGVSPLLCKSSQWQNPGWRFFLASQQEHVEHRHRRIAALLERIDTDARAVDLAIVPLKGSALHALRLYEPGRPSHGRHRPAGPRGATRDRRSSCCKSSATWNRSSCGSTMCSSRRRASQWWVWANTATLRSISNCIRASRNAAGIHRRHHPADLSAAAPPGLNPYPSDGALMSHLLLHAAGNICGRSLRLLHLNDIARLWRRACRQATGTPCGTRTALMLPGGRCRRCAWSNAITQTPSPKTCWPDSSLDCHPLLKIVSRRQTLTQVSCSELWHHALHGIEWSALFVISGVTSGIASGLRTKMKERADMVRTQIWLQGKAG
jgi:hypothetical protein